jgi:hypothetical protein
MVKIPLSIGHQIFGWLHSGACQCTTPPLLAQATSGGFRSRGGLVKL